ncbi:energy-coupling factor transporter transmembrane component T family protein [Psychrobacillus soli]|uniref:Energy-coupling factor transporter transmembrane protein EcfT n=1 Tax=Psychrobacillus soli TaxID=1543965 RepID=A0A544TJX9_9BACI|nr:energy-coupling factor transporter transmembrane component T [Psychrobacillus soli]TQR17728.1 energy-coupling factor transporter transmembrane protein EcfT [Psychrobacillus soli]
MSDTILIGQYMETNSVFHRLDPRTKILSLFIIMLSFLMLKTATSFTIVSLFVFGILMLSKIPFPVFMKGLKPILFILTFTFVYNVLLTKGNVIWSWSFIDVTAEGLQNGVRFVWRIILLVLLASILTLTTKPLELASGLEKLLAPLSKFHVPVEQFSLMIVIAIRFIPTILQELDRIILAQKARGHDIVHLPLVKRMLAYIPILIPLLFTTIQRAEQLTYAIDARAYGKGKGRTAYKLLQFQQIDYVVGMIAVLFVITVIIIRLGGL